MMDLKTKAYIDYKAEETVLYHKKRDFNNPWSDLVEINKANSEFWKKYDPEYYKKHVK